MRAVRAVSEREEARQGPCRQASDPTITIPGSVQDQMLCEKNGKYIPGRLLCVPQVLFTLVPRNTDFDGFDQGRG